MIFKNFKKNFNVKLSFRKKLIFSFVIFGFIPVLIVTIFSLYNLLKAKGDEINRASYESLKFATDAVNDMFLSNMQKNLYLSNLTEIYNLSLINGEENTIYRIDANNNMRNIVEALTTDTVKSSIFLYSYDEKAHFNDLVKNIKELPQYVRNNIESSDDISGSWNVYSIQNDNMSEQYVSLFNRNSFSNNNIVVTEIRVPFESVKKQFIDKVPNESFLIYSYGKKAEETLNLSDLSSFNDANNTIKNYFAGAKINDYSVTKLDIKTIGHSVILFQRNSYIYNLMTNYLVYGLFIAIFILTMFFLVIQFVTNILTNKLNKLINNIDIDINELIKNGNEIKTQTLEDEFSVINNKIYELILFVRDHYQKFFLLEVEHNKLRFDILQDSINPHLIYNTLAIIKTFSKDTEVRNVVDSLTKYFRIALSKGDRFIKVEQEIDLAIQYLKIQKYSYDYEFNYEVDVSKDILDCKIIKIILQPIIENSLFHGLSENGTEGVLKIKGWLEDGYVFLEVSDNGIGMSEQQINMIMGGINKKSIRGYGLQNVISRLKSFYGTNYDFLIVSQKDKGTKIVLKIPCEKIDE